MSGGASIDVNLIGQVAVTRALLPAILRARGRVVNMSSIGGRVASPLFGPYSASKFALEAVSDALRREVAAHGVRVVSIEPGGIATPIWGKGMDDARRLTAGMSDEAVRRYEKLIPAVTRIVERLAREGLPPEAVAEVVGRAVTARRPRARYVVGRDAKIQAIAARLLPDAAMDALIGERLLEPVDHAGAREVVRRDLYADAVTRVHADAGAAHAAGHMGQHEMPVVELDAEHQVRQRLLDDALEGELLFDGHGCHLQIRVGTSAEGAAAGRRGVRKI